MTPGAVVPFNPPVKHGSDIHTNTYTHTLARARSRFYMIELNCHEYKQDCLDLLFVFLSVQVESNYKHHRLLFGMYKMPVARNYYFSFTSANNGYYVNNLPCSSPPLLVLETK